MVEAIVIFHKHMQKTIFPKLYSCVKERKMKQGNKLIESIA